MSTQEVSSNVEAIVAQVAQARSALLTELHRVIIGQDEMLEQMLIAIFARGHCLTIGVPGLAKTLTISTLAQTLALRFHRIQFTPDLMPSDITGTQIIDQDPATGQRSFRFVPGPIFANIVLADEINRTPPKTQAALLQAMQEYEVTSAGQTYTLEKPFFVMATQNPIEQEGTYPLPEAQLDRFMLSIYIGYPTRDEERQIVMATTASHTQEVRAVLGVRDILQIQQLVRQMPVAPHMVDYAVDLIRATRPKESSSPKFVQNWLAWGAGPRAAQNIILTAKARALLHGRFAVTADDIRAMTIPVLRHRIFTNFNADAEGVDVVGVIEQILRTIPEPSYGEPVTVAKPTISPNATQPTPTKPTATTPTTTVSAVPAQPASFIQPTAFAQPSPTAQPAPSVQLNSSVQPTTSTVASQVPGGVVTPQRTSPSLDERREAAVAAARATHVQPTAPVTHRPVPQPPVSSPSLAMPQPPVSHVPVPPPAQSVPPVPPPQPASPQSPLPTRPKMPWE